MNAPVIAPVAGGRPPAPRASDAGRAHSAAPFASALDGALSENRSTHAPDRGAPDRAQRDAEKDQRPVDRSAAAAQRAADKADRIEARADRAAARAEAKANASDGPTGPGDDRTTSEDAAAPVAPVAEESTEDSAPAPEAPRGGLPALWALVMGGSLGPAPAVDTVPADGGATPPVGPLVAATATAVAAPVPTQDATAVMPATSMPTVPVATPAEAAAPVAAAPAAASAVQGSDGLPAGFTAVLADALGTPAGTAAAPVLPPATAPAAPAAAAPLPVDAAVEVVVPAAASATTAPAPAPSVAAPAPAGSSDATTSETTGVGPASADAVVATAGTSGEAPSSDAGTGQDSGAGNAPAGTGATAGPAAPVAPTATAAVADVDGVTGGAAALPVASQVARQVAVLSGGPDGEHSMTLVLTPDTLGEVQVQVTLNKGAIELALRGSHEHGRAALLEALPELRRDLEAAGLNPSRLEVARETGGSLLDRQPTQQQGFGERGGQHDRGENRSRPWSRPADIGGSGSPVPNRSTSSGVDVRV
jgi:flagellar hook-length control protein FliK